MSQTLDYLFFNFVIQQQFENFLVENALPYVQHSESVTGAMVIAVEEALVSPALWDELDQLYDQLHEQDQVLLEQSVNDPDGKNVAGIYLQLANGQYTIAKVAPDVVNRILTVISMDELNQLVDAIVQSVENPQQATLCQL